MKDTSIIKKRELGDDIWLCLRRMLFGNTRLSLVEGDPDVVSCSHVSNYCYHDGGLALDAYEAWDGRGDPPKGWVRHIETGRRYDPATGREWVAP
jgi:hypothetical protein